MGNVLDFYFLFFVPTPTTDESHVTPFWTLHCLGKWEGAWSKVWGAGSWSVGTWAIGGCKTLLEPCLNLIKFKDPQKISLICGIGGNIAALGWSELGWQGGMQQLAKKELVHGGGIPNWNARKPSKGVGEASEVLGTWVDIGSCTLHPCW